MRLVAGFAKSVAFMRDAGANGCTIVGVLGESNRLTDNEREQLITTAMKVSNEGRSTCKEECVKWYCLGFGI